MRLFIAIEIPPLVKQEMAALQDQLRHTDVDAAWVRPEGMHLTLKFLGDVPETRSNAIMDALVYAAQGRGGFRMEISGVGTFPHTGNPRVVWVGVQGDADMLRDAQTSVEGQMLNLGFAREDRDFFPHLTLGRIRQVRSRSAWKNAFDKLKDIRLSGFHVDSISLMQSELHSSGAVYTEIGRVLLKGTQ